MRGEVFRDVHVALNTSYRMAATPAVDAGATRRALIRIASLHPVQSRIQADWVLALIGQPSPVVDLSGLSRLEARAQCALVCQSVERLTYPQACAVLARFAQTPSEKQTGVSGLVMHLSSISPASPEDDPLEDPLYDLLWRRYLPQAYGDGLSLRAIARRTHTSKSALSRLAERIDQELDPLERDAMKNLEQNFVSQGLCEALLARLDSNPCY
jgi:hypothetical protein